jgi:Nif-specific ferredoxin III
MSVFTVELPAGIRWIPKFATAIDQEKCIGCGRCFKVCGRDVMGLIGLDEDGNPVDGDDEDEYEKQVMQLLNRENCIGCEACSRVCPKGCYTNSELTI